LPDVANNPIGAGGRGASIGIAWTVSELGLWPASLWATT
jgi:hypothetical protein